jgi:hypothetical protein
MTPRALGIAVPVALVLAASGATAQQLASRPPDVRQAAAQEAGQSRPTRRRICHAR